VSGDTLTYVDPQGNIYANRTPNYVSSSELDYDFNDASDRGLGRSRSTVLLLLPATWTSP